MVGMAADPFGAHQVSRHMADREAPGIFMLGVITPLFSQYDEFQHLAQRWPFQDRV